MRRFALWWCLLMGCVPMEQEPELTHEPVFTLPFARGVERYVWRPGDDVVEITGGSHEVLRAPADGFVREVWDRGLRFVSHDYAAELMLDGLEQVDARMGGSYCGGEVLGVTDNFTITARWLDLDAATSDLSMVRIVRHHTVTDLSDVRLADPISSVLWVPGAYEYTTNLNGSDCPWTREENEP